MKICFPVSKNSGIESVVFNHFGSAPTFLIVDSETKEVVCVDNANKVHAHGACNPVAALNNNHVDIIAVSGIGAGALSKLNHAGIRVFKSNEGSVSENIELIKQGKLKEYKLSDTCAGHGHGHSCSH